MSAASEGIAKAESGSGLGFFERWLTLWVGLCIVAGIALGQIAPGFFQEALDPDHVRIIFSDHRFQIVAQQAHHLVYPGQRGG